MVFQTGNKHEILCLSGTFCFRRGDDYLKLFYPDSVENMTRNFWAMTGFTSATCLCVIFIFKIRGIPNLSWDHSSQELVHAVKIPMQFYKSKQSVTSSNISPRFLSGFYRAFFRCKYGPFQIAVPRTYVSVIINV